MTRWTVMGIVALLLVVGSGDLTHWPLVASSPARVAETRLSALTDSDINARTQPLPIHEGRQLVRHQLTEQAANQIAAARHHVALTLAGLVVLWVTWRQGRKP